MCDIALHQEGEAGGKEGIEHEVGGGDAQSVVEKKKKKGQLDGKSGRKGKEEEVAEKKGEERGERKMPWVAMKHERRGGYRPDLM